jgi:hypothetical protein
MPALTMRGRYLMREYWSDSDLFLKLKADERELYQGLWMLADDTGWMPRDIPGIAAALYRFEDRGPREAKVRSGLSRLATLGKVKSLRCGCLFLQSVVKYPRAGKKTDEHARNHQSHSKGFKSLRQSDSNGFEPTKSDLNPSPVQSLPDPSRPTGAQAREDRLPPFETVLSRRSS